MDQSQQELRRAAAKAFMESLNHLEKSLQPSEGECSDLPDPVSLAEVSLADPVPVEPISPVCPPAIAVPSPAEPRVKAEGRSFKMDLDALEAAAADIEQYMQHKEEVGADEES
ncbi:MAG: hypothetical protein MUF49_20625 [Oculatellaceae cyanobacterium Prado106]|jgi:hypothetical protein|nr:hypothetical protein [Oculatellaceae cyanobacterium Prado106]